MDRAGRPATGLNRTGKSCRLRWFNYLHPGLNHGRMTPQEELLILQLHSEWGNRWSRIARRLPGRTDNVIKNYWRTHMRKKAQDQRKMSSSQSASTSLNCYVSAEPPLDADSLTIETGTRVVNEDSVVKAYPMEQIWNDIAFSESAYESCNMKIDPPPIISPLQEQLADLWMMDG